MPLEYANHRAGWPGFGDGIPGSGTAIRQMTDEEKAREYDKLHPRVKKLLARDRDFIVISEKEPYYIEAYKLIRKHEESNGAWTEEDRVRFANAVMRSGQCSMCDQANDNCDEHPRCSECTTICVCCKDAVASKLTWATVQHADGTDQQFPVRTCEDCDPTHAMLEAMPPVR